MFSNGSNSPKETLEEKHKRILSERPTVDDDLLKQLGLDEGRFRENFTRLCEKWWDFWGHNTAIDTVGKRLVTSTLASHLNNPVILSMIVDDIDSFRKYYTEKDGDIFCLEFSCICGSERIIKDFFMNDPDKKKCLNLSQNVIGYALSSGKENLVLLIAKEALILGRDNPGPLMLYSFGNNTAIQCVQALFNTPSISRRLTPPPL